MPRARVLILIGGRRLCWVGIVHREGGVVQLDFERAVGVDAEAVPPELDGELGPCARFGASCRGRVELELGAIPIRVACAMIARHLLREEAVYAW